jgi:quinol monooxygenase YgiN
MNTALFVRHKAKPGQRDEVQRIWEKHVKPRAAANPGHLAYYFCFDETDTDVVSVFQLYSSKEAMTAFLSGEWYPIYLAEIAEAVAEAPQVMSASLVWQKQFTAEQ